MRSEQSLQRRDIGAPKSAMSPARLPGGVSDTDHDAHKADGARVQTGIVVHLRAKLATA